jgi:plastocyanin
VKYRQALWGAVTLLFLAACASSPATSSPTAAPGGATPSGSGGGAGPQTATVNMTDAFQFVPPSTTIKSGGTVTWMNTGSQPHTITDDPSKAINAADSALPSGAQAWDSGFINGGQSYSHTFTTPGQYTYFCTPHESLGMVARITVTP